MMPLPTHDVHDDADMPVMSVPCLVGLVELQQECEKLSLKLSLGTRRFLVYEMMKTLGLNQSQRLISKFVSDGIITWEDDFEVESVLDHDWDEEKEETYYLIKWLGWGHEHNTWEPQSNLNCDHLLHNYDLVNRQVGSKRKRTIHFLQQDLQASKRRRLDELFEKLMESKIMEKLSPQDMITYYNSVKRETSKKRLLNHFQPKILRRKKSQKLVGYEMQKALKAWEREMNKMIKGFDSAPIFVENHIDLEGPPDSFIYINERKEGPGVVIPKDPLIGCDCEDCHFSKKSCCPVASGSTQAYYKSKARLRVPRGVPIYECNSRCKCGADCYNRVAQKGRRFKICIFRTRCRGWGVKTLQEIRKGAFVVEYVGEVITNEEAERRGKEYDAVGRTYLFDLDFHEDNAPFSVDAGTYGNVAHFINHSCDPNLEVHVVWINTLDPRLPHICLYAKRDIGRDEELTFDYMSGNLMNEEGSFSEEQIVDTTSSEEATPLIGNEPLTSKEGLELDPPELFQLPSLPMDELWTKEKPKHHQESLKEFLKREKRQTNKDMLTQDFPTPPCSDNESVTDRSTSRPSVFDKKSQFSMACLCNASNCRKFLFF